MSVKRRVLLGMSGGVDSSTSAILLQEKGYEVIGVTLNLFKENEETIKDAKRVCEQLGIEHYILDEQDIFREKVINDFLEKYKNAKTPNPCIECNRYLKFGAMYEKAKELKADYIATGHYARVEFSEKYNRHVIKKSSSIKKDQSYVLYGINPEVVEHIIFPLEGFETKDEIRKIAENHNLVVAQKSESQEICFITDNDYIRYLKENLSEKDRKNAFRKGNIVTCDGCVKGKHCGIANYTIGQRKGLGIQNATPLYVTKIDKANNQVIVGEKSETYSKETYVEELNWLAIEKLEETMNIKAKIRYSAREAEAVISMVDSERVKVEFVEPQMAITPGQAIVFYDGDIVVGGGKIV